MYHLPNPATLMTHQPADTIKPELTNVKLPPIHQITPEQQFNYSSSASNYASDISRRPSVSSVASSGFTPSRSTSPAFSSSALEPQYGGNRPLDRLRLQAGHVFPYTHDSAEAASRTRANASKKKRDDRKQYSKRASAGKRSSKVQKSDNEAGNRYMQALDQAALAAVCRQANPNIENTAAPQHGGPGAWTPLKSNNINWDVRQDNVEPSMWNKCSVNGSAILLLRHSNEQLADTANWLDEMAKQWSSTPKELLLEQIKQHKQCLVAAASTRGETHWKSASERMVYDC